MAQGEPQAPRGTVLVVEDDEASAALLAALLEEEGFRPIICPDGQTAMPPFEQERPVAVLIDWVIPGGSGIELCRWMRSQDALVPIFFVSGRADEASVSRGLDAGADDFLSKPFRPRELAARLDAHLRKLAGLPVRATTAVAAADRTSARSARSRSTWRRAWLAWPAGR